MNEAYIDDRFVGFPYFSKKLGTMREIPRNPTNSHFMEEA
jgi:hypothetical protein